MSQSSIGVLQEYFQKNNLPAPTYTVVDQKSGTHINSFTVRVSCDSYHTDATASTKKAAKHAAASQMIKLLKNHNIYIDYKEPTLSATTKQELSRVVDGLGDIAIASTSVPLLSNSVGKLQVN